MILGTESALNVMSVIALVMTVVGLAAVAGITIPQTVRDLRSYSRDTPERVLFVYDLRGALLGAGGLLVMLAILIAIVLTDPGLLRSSITRPLTLVLLACLVGICVLAPLRRRAIERAARRRAEAHRATQHR